MTPAGRRFLLVNLSLLASIMLAIFPLPNWLEAARPDWLALVLMYWCMAMPAYIRFTAVLAFGLLLDIAAGTLLGQHALGLVLVSFAVLKNHARLRMFPLAQQGMFIMLLVLMKQLLFLWIYGITNNAPDNLWLYFLPSVVALFLWPVLFVFMESLQRRFPTG